MEHSRAEDKPELKVTTQLKRWYRWRYSGPITVFSIIIVAVLSWQLVTNTIEFYDKFTCPQLMEYKNGDFGVSGMPDYEELSEQQKQKFSIGYNECLEMGWAAR